MMTHQRPGHVPGEAYATVTSATPVYEMQQQTAAPSGPAPRVIAPQRDLTVQIEVTVSDLVVAQTE
jgi:hypothetical protein